MRIISLLALAGSILAAPLASAQLAITETMSSESTNLGSGLVIAGPDFWELSNFGATAIDLTGYAFNDSDATRGGDADHGTFSGVSIAAGESIILVQSGTAGVANRDAFINWWGATNVPANLQVLFYSGNGLSASGDSIVLWAPTATSDADILDRADFGEALRGHSFIYNPSNGVFGVVSSNGILGAFKAVTADDEASPGRNPGAVPLKITQQPAPATFSTPAGQNVTFTVTAQGLPRAHYQWRLNGTNLDGAIQSSLTLSNVQAGSTGNYSVVVSNGLQTATSSNAALTVTTSPVPPAFISSPVGADAYIGQQVRFIAAVNGSPTPALQWFKDNNPLVGENGAVLNLSSVQTNDTGIYKLVAANFAGTNTVSLTLMVGAKPLLAITEVHPTGSTGHEDWWELTSFDTRVFNLKGWRWDDSSHSVAPNNAFVFPNDIFIHPGESIVFVENMPATNFLAWWGASNLPAGLQIITYVAGGIGLSATADEVNLWNAVTLVGNELSERVCAVNFAASPVGVTFVYDPENPPIAGIMSVLSSNTVAGAAANGIFAAAVGGNFGSPGYVVAPLRVAVTLENGTNVALSWNTTPGRTYPVLYKTNLNDSAWWLLTSITAGAANTNIVETTVNPQRYYRLGVTVPFVSEP